MMNRPRTNAIWGLTLPRISDTVKSSNAKEREEILWLTLWKNSASAEKTAWITGASYGIGFAIAKAFHAAGARIVFNDINQELVDRGLNAYREEGIPAQGFVCDVTDEQQVTDLVRHIESDIAPIDILVNNAGIIRRVPMIEMSVEEFRKVVDVDLNALLFVPRLCCPA